MAKLPLDITLIQSLLSSKTVSTEITSANDLTTPGFYFVDHPQLADLPTADWCHIFVNANTEKNHIVQICVPDKAQSLWFRTKSTVGWSDWKTFVM